jgi:nicotinamide-nucleotide amidase
LGLAGPVATDVVELTLYGSRWDIRLAAVQAAISELRLFIARS